MQTKYAPPLAALAFLWSANLCAQAPEIRIVEPEFSEAMETSASSIEIRGVAKGPGVKNVFIHEQSGTMRRLLTEAAEDGAELTFRTGAIPLKRGLNDIVLTAVEKGNRASAKHLTIVRSGGDEAFAPMRTGLWRGRTVLYQEIDGLAIAEGDIVLGAAGEIPPPGLPEAQAQSRKGIHRYGFTQDFPSELWPLSGGVRKVPYVITASTNAAGAISAFNASLTGIIQFVARTTETDFVNFNQTGSGGGCVSSLGRIGGVQTITGDVACAVPTLIHEMGHAIGLYHEHQRPDRASYITLNLNNTDISIAPGNFDNIASDMQTIGLYSYSSIMHYGALTFSKNNQPVMETIPAGIPLSNSTGFSKPDIDTIARLYRVPVTQVTVTSNPQGLSVTVDGSTVTTPQTFAWVIGSNHSVGAGAAAQTNGDGAVYQFGNWNDSGAQTHSFTVTAGAGTATAPASQPAITVYEANFVRYWPFAISVVTPSFVTNSGLGSGSPSPSPIGISGQSGSFFADRAQVTVTGTPNGANQFYGWFNVPTPSGLNPNTFNVNSGAALLLAFDTGAVTRVGVTLPSGVANPGLPSTIAGSPFVIPRNFSVAGNGATFNGGNQVQIAATTPAIPVTTNARYNFQSWSDSGAQTHNITSPASGSLSVSASYTPSWRGYSTFNPACAATSTAPLPDAFYTHNSPVTLSVTPASGWFFTGYTGITGANGALSNANPQTFNVLDQLAIVANLNTSATPLAVTGFSPASATVSGAAFTLDIQGTGFSASTLALVNLGTRTTTFVSSTLIRVAITSADLATPGGLSVGAYNFTNVPSCSVFVTKDFQILPLPPSTLSITKTHVGNFTQGQNGTYTVTVSNAAGASPASGTVTVTDTVPGGMTLVSMAGTGWTCPGGGPACTRSDALASGSSYPPLTVTITVAVSASTPQVNSAAVSGGGSASANASDSTNILSAFNTISGTVFLNGFVLSGVTMTITGTQSGTTTTDASGNYSFSGLVAGGTFEVTPSRLGYAFGPGSITYNGLQGNASANFNANPASANLALGKTATQSSTFQAASKAVDGNTDGNLANGSVSHTYFDANAWWQVDLGAQTPIGTVVVWNRTDCCSSRLADFWVFVSNTPFLATDTPATLQNRAGTWSSRQTAQPSPSTSIQVGGVQGQYVRVQLSGSDYLQLAEVQVFSNGLPNLSAGRTASQSSTFQPASRALDGNTDGNLANNSVSHTYSDANAWWQVDLATPASVNSVVVWNRTDCCGSRLTDYWVFVSNTPFLATDTPATLQNRAGTWNSHQTTAPSPSSAILAGGAIGRYVRVQLSGTDYLQLGEVQVLGTALTNIAGGKTATQSSTFLAASRAVDGNTNGDIANNSMSHTYADASAWWQVDLAAQSNVSAITVWNRTDCCASRLADYWVFVSPTPFNSTDTPAVLQSRSGVWSNHQTSAPGPSTTITTTGATGQYVRVQLTGTDYLTLAEVQVFGTAITNLSQGKTAAQSSTFQAASKAVDGNTDGNLANGSVSHTYNDPNSWWQVDLGSQAIVNSILVWNRTDFGGNRLSDYWVFVSNTPFSPSDTPATLQGRAGVYANHQTSAPGPVTAIATGGVTGQYVRVQLSGTDYLQLAEVQVFGTAVTNVAVNKTASQSSTFQPASRAVDGNTDGSLPNNSVSHTYSDANAWWQVDLASNFTVSAVTVWNRTDCCASRLADYWVFVSNTPFLASDTPATLQSRAGTFASHQTAAPNPAMGIVTGGVQGRYVRVQLSGADYLQLAEVQVQTAP